MYACTTKSGTNWKIADFFVFFLVDQPVCLCYVHVNGSCSIANCLKLIFIELNCDDRRLDGGSIRTLVGQICGQFQFLSMYVNVIFSPNFNQRN